MDAGNEPSKPKRVVLRVTASILGVVAVLVIVGLTIARSQDGAVKVPQAWRSHSQWGYPPNAFEPRNAPWNEGRPDGLRVRHDVRYAEQYPNSHFDFWYPDADQGVQRPTVVWIHGGGWFMGDTVTGDPMAGASGADVSEPMASLAKSGFSVVNLNYALSPDDRYPVQIRQLNQAIAYLEAHSSTLGVDMTNLVIMGGSAGAHMSAQYGLLVSDPAYAAGAGIVPSIEASRVKAVVLYVAPLKFSGFGWRFNAMMWSYLGTKDLENSPQAKQTNILAHFGPRYPATYLTDGNQADRFPEHAKAMARLLRNNGVGHVFNYYEPSEAQLGHGYTGQRESKQGRENFERTMQNLPLSSDPRSRAPCDLDRPEITPTSLVTRPACEPAATSGFLSLAL